MAETASWKKKVKEYQCYLTLKAYLAVTEQKENNKENLNERVLHMYKESVSDERDLTEDEKDAVLLGNEKKTLGGDKIWKRAKLHKKEIVNHIMGIWNADCTPSGTAAVEQSMELLRQRYWLHLKKESNKKKRANKPDIVLSEPTVCECPKGWTNPVLFAFKKLHDEKALAKFRAPTCSTKTGALRSTIASRKTQRKTEAKFQKSIKTTSSEQAKIDAFNNHSCKKLKIAHEKNVTMRHHNRTQRLHALLEIAKTGMSSSTKSGQDSGQKFLEKLLEKEMEAYMKGDEEDALDTEDDVSPPSLSSPKSPITVDGSDKDATPSSERGRGKYRVPEGEEGDFNDDESKTAAGGSDDCEDSDDDDDDDDD